MWSLSDLQVRWKDSWTENTSILRGTWIEHELFRRRMEVLGVESLRLLYVSPRLPEKCSFFSPHHHFDDALLLVADEELTVNCRNRSILWLRSACQHDLYASPGVSAHAIM